MIDKKWFLLINSKVSGPHTTQDILNSLNNLNLIESIHSGQFWSKGQNSWKPIDAFRDFLKIENQKRDQTQNSQIHWFIKNSDSETGPLSFESLIQILKEKLDHKSIMICQELNQSSERQWKPIYHFESVIEKLGISRRKFPRVPIEGIMTIVEGLLKGRKAELFSLSQGGLGARGLTEVSLGEKIKGIITSKNLPLPIHFQGEIVFSNTKKNELGIQYTNLSTEALTQIIAYVKQFTESNPGIDFKKAG